MKGYAEFEFDLRAALLDKLVMTFDGMEGGELSQAAAIALPDAQGVYQLLLGGHVVYVGKTDADAGLRLRLQRHASKILHRRDLDPREVSFKALRIFVFTPMDLEAEIIKRYGGVSGASWNGSGFGSNDPGRERDTTKLKTDHFDIRYPIDLDRKLDVDLGASISAADALRILNSSVPYLIRWEGGARRPPDDLSATKVSLGKSETTARSALTAIVAQLPEGWQATELPGYAILYKEREEYAHGRVIARS